MGINKIVAARRQLDCAIRLFFENEDSLAVHSLAYASFRILFDSHQHLVGDGRMAELEALIARSGWHNFTKVPNFLKHADRDPFDEISDHLPEHVQPTIGFALLLYEQIVGKLTPEMRAFHYWIKVMHPEEFNLERDADEDFERNYRASLPLIKGSSWETQLLLGNTLLKTLKSQE